MTEAFTQGKEYLRDRVGSLVAEDRKILELKKYGIAGCFPVIKDFSEGVAMIETVLRLNKNLK